MSNAGTSTTTTPPAEGSTLNTGSETAEERSANSTQGSNNAQTRGQSNNGGTAFRISNFKGEVAEVGAVIGTKSVNRTKDLMTLFQEKIASYVMLRIRFF